MSGTRLIPKLLNDGGGGSADLSTISGDATATAGGVLSLANSYKKLALIDIAGNNKTITAAAIVNKFVTRTTTGISADVLDTAANILTAMSGIVTVNTKVEFYLWAGDHQITITAPVDIGWDGTCVLQPYEFIHFVGYFDAVIVPHIAGEWIPQGIYNASDIGIMIGKGGGSAGYKQLVSGGNNYLFGSNAGNTALESKAPADVLSQIDAAASGHNHSGTYQPAAANLTTYAGIAPSANAQTLLGETFAQMQASLSIDDLITLSGVAEGSANLGTFTGTTIADSVTIKAALQALETSLELKQTGDATLTALAGLTIQDVSIIEGTGADAFNVVVSGGGNRLLGANSGNTALEFKDTIAVTSITDTIKIVDADAATKAIQFDCGNITAGQTRIYSTPDVAGSLVLGPSAGFITFSGPTQARAFALPDEAVSIVTNSASQALNIITSGTLQGLVKVTSKGAGATLTAAEMSGGVVLVTAAVTIELPAVTVGQSVLIYGTGANIVTVHPNASDRIILDGVDKTDHVSIACTAAAGSFIGLFGDSAAGWTTLGKAGTWA